MNLIINEPNLSSLRDLERLSTDAVRVLLYDTREYTITMQLTALQNRKRQATTSVTITRQVS